MTLEKGKEMKKVFSLILSLVIACAIALPAATTESEAAFSARTTVPAYGSAAGSAYYYTNNNIFYRSGYGPNQVRRSDGKYVTGNCTWYAYGRASEILGKTFNTAFRWDASKWWDINKQGNYYPYGSTPKVGAIACYSTHVAVVEKVVNGKPYVSESSWTLSTSKPTSASNIVFHYGTPWSSKLKGYIYITDSTSSSATATSVSYSVKITDSDLNMRTGPGTSYTRIGYVKSGTYKVDQECGNWVRLADSGYWVCSSYVTKVTTTTETVVSTGTDANYTVKISAVNLNMRTGPGTSYTRKGYISPGTYTITKTSGNWGLVKETGYWVCLTYTTKVTTSSSGSSSSNSSSSSTGSSGTSYQVKVTADALNMRTGPGTSYSSKGLLTRGSTRTIIATKDGWGQMSENGYWIKLSYTTPVNAEYNVKVTDNDLNMRTGPGTSYASKGYVPTGVHTIVQTDNGWGKLKSNGYWIKLSYTTKL